MIAESPRPAHSISAEKQTERECPGLAHQTTGLADDHESHGNCDRSEQHGRAGADAECRSCVARVVDTQQASDEPDGLALVHRRHDGDLAGDVGNEYDDGRAKEQCGAPVGWRRPGGIR